MSDISVSGYNALPASMRGSFHYDQARGVWTTDPNPSVDTSPMQNGYNPTTNTYGPRPPQQPTAPVAPPVAAPVQPPPAPRAYATATSPVPQQQPQQQQQPAPNYFAAPTPAPVDPPRQPIAPLIQQADVLNPPVNYVAPPPPPPVAPIALPKHADEDPAARKAASDAAYASAKDNIGATGRSSLTALREEMGSRGITGSGLEGREDARLIGGMQGQLGQVTRDQSAAELARGNAVSDEVYSAGTGAATTNATIAAGERSGNQAAGLSNAAAATNQGNTNNANRRASLQTLATLRSGGIY